MSYDVCFGMTHSLRALVSTIGPQIERPRAQDAPMLSKRPRFICDGLICGRYHKHIKNGCCFGGFPRPLGTDPHFFRMTQHNFNSMEYLKLLDKPRLFLHYLFPAFLILAPNPGYRTRVNLKQEGLRKRWRPSRETAWSLYHGMIQAGHVLAFHDVLEGRRTMGWGGWRTPRLSNEEVAKNTFVKIHRL